MKNAREIRIAAFLLCAVFAFIIPGSAFAEEYAEPIFLSEEAIQEILLPDEEIGEYSGKSVNGPEEYVLPSSVSKEDPGEAALKAAIEEELALMEKTNRMETSFRTANLAGIRAEIVAGKCGEDCYFSLYSDGCLEITGKGKVSDSDGWQGYEDKITKLVIDGPDTLGNNLFNNCMNLKFVSLNTTVEDFGNNVFDTSVMIDSQKEMAEEFVTRCYHYALGREGDKAGLNIWTEALLNEKSSPEQVVNAFLFSPEAEKLNRTDSDYIERLYHLCLDRDADSEGLNYWVGAMENGMTREQIAEAFSSSAEFSGLLENYGLK